jgi:chaperone modulatory protein CbpM
MAIRKDDVLAHIERISLTRLDAWIQQDCVRPDPADGELTFSEADLARLRLICTLQDDFDLDDDALSMVLSLIDQLHGVRRALRELVNAVDSQPSDVRAEIARRFHAGFDPVP